MLNSEITLPILKKIKRNNELSVQNLLKCSATDFAIILGCPISTQDNLLWDKSLKGRKCRWRLIGASPYKHSFAITGQDEYINVAVCERKLGIRIVIHYDDVKELEKFNITKNDIGFDTLEYGEYPQYAADVKIEKELDNLFRDNKLMRTGKVYTIDKTNIDKNDVSFQPMNLEEYEYKGKRYVRIQCRIKNHHYLLSNQEELYDGDIYWIEVEPLTWYIDYNNHDLICKNVISAGVRYCDDKLIPDDFSKTEMYYFLNNYLKNEIICSKDIFLKNRNIKDNAYGLKFDDVNEEDIIKGCIESNIAVFLHGLSSDGKSARVKQLDPNCTIIYLRNATPESLNGKSVYNQEKGEMIDIKPSWLMKLEEKCQKEPDKLHILFFDELTNALLSIQGMAFNIILDKEVNGRWLLPENVRIVAAGNDLEDSKAANELAEPLFNRFAHVYIKTTTESWLKWASSNNIHPAIYAFIAYNNGMVLRSKYNGITPNADPRKWEMASKVLYKTNNPFMLRSLIGEDITNEFVNFCNQSVITLEDILNDNYTIKEINQLNVAKRYSTIINLLRVDLANVEKVYDFVEKIGNEFVSLFASLWCRDDIDRLEKIQEIKLKNEEKRLTK